MAAKLLPLLILLIGIGLSLQQYEITKQQSEAILKARFNTDFNEMILHLGEKVEAYDQMLRATQGLFYANEAVSRDDFQEFTNQLDIEVFYPGLLGLGYAPLIKPEDKAKHIAEVREAGFPDYDIQPEGAREFYTTILYLEPFSERNLKAFGYDMASEANRREAMLRARDNQTTALSAGVKLVQDLSGESTIGLLMYLPLFSEITLPTGDQMQNQHDHQGWVYAVFRIDDIINTMFAEDSYPPKLRVTDLSDDNKQVLYQSADAFNDNFILTNNLTLGGRLWQFESQPSELFVDQYQPVTPLRNLIIGLLLSSALAIVVWLLIVGRVRAEKLAQQMTSKLRAQNQRLSLASDTAQMGIWEWSFSTDQVFMDGSLVSLMFGSTEQVQQLSYQQWLQKFEVSDQSRLHTAIEKAITNREDVNVDVLLPQGTGDTRMIQISGVLQFNNQGAPERILGVSFDITERWQSQQQLMQTEARWKYALEGSGEGVWDWTIKDNVVQFSDKLIRMLDYNPAEFKPSFEEWAERIHPDDRQQAFANVELMLNGTRPDYYSEFRMRCKDGSWKWILARGTVIERDADGVPVRAVGTHTDIDLQKAESILLKQSEERFRNAFDTAPIGMALVDIYGNWLEVNESLCELLGYQEAELLKLTFMDITHPDDLELDLEYVKKLIHGQLDNYQMEKRYFRKDGQKVDVLLSVSVVHDANGKVLHFVSQIEDISARKREQDRIHQLAFYDALTGLPNRRLFEERIGQAMHAARRQKHQLALMFIDVDHFKHINDNFGHDIGDEAIKAVAYNMQAVLRSSDTLARFGGDEFVVLLCDVPNSQAVLTVAENLLQTVTEKKLQFDDRSIRITLSIGVAMWAPEQDEKLVGWMKKADIALYEVKARGRNAASLYESSAD